MIYLAEHEHGFIKVGRSKNPDKRVVNINSSCPYSVELLTTIETDGDSGVERTLHTYLGKYRKSGEWFDLPVEVEKELVKVQHLSDVHGFWKRVLRYSTEEYGGKPNSKPLLEIAERPDPTEP